MLDHVEKTGTETLIDETHVDTVWTGVQKVVAQLNDVHHSVWMVVENLLDPLRDIGEDAALVLCRLHVGRRTAVDLHGEQGARKLVTNKPHRRILSPTQLAKNDVLLGKHLSYLPIMDSHPSSPPLDDNRKRSNL